MSAEKLETLFGMTPFTLTDFVRESNRIEGILGSPARGVVEAHEVFLCHDILTVGRMEAFVAVIAPGKRLRIAQGMNVRVGRHVAPPGGPGIFNQLLHILESVRQHDTEAQCFAVHRQYETLHPFMDGNGRSGRVLWLWMMGGINKAPLGFLHHWYYQTLQNSR